MTKPIGRIRVKICTSAAIAVAILVAVLRAANPAPPPIRFREVAAQAGISFVLENHPTDRKHLIE